MNFWYYCIVAWVATATLVSAQDTCEYNCNGYDWTYWFGLGIGIGIVLGVMVVYPLLWALIHYRRSIIRFISCGHWAKDTPYL